MKHLTTFLASTLLISTNAFAYSPSSRVCKNDRVVFDYNFSGTVVEVFNNGTVKIDSDSHTSYQMRNIRDIGVARRCVENICANSRVNFDNSFSGRITEVYDNGIVKIDSDSHTSYQYRRIQDVGAENRCVANVCKNDRVSFDYNFSGKVEEIYDNGMVKINSDSHSSYQYRRIQDVGVARRCISQLCVHDGVSFDYNFTGRIAEIYDNGIVKINSDSHSSYQYRRIQDLGAEVRCSTSQGPRMICY